MNCAKCNHIVTGPFCDICFQTEHAAYSASHRHNMGIEIYNKPSWVERSFAIVLTAVIIFGLAVMAMHVRLQ